MAKAFGYAALFNSRSVDLGGFVERIAPGAFKNALAKCDVRALYNHDPSQLLGRTSAGTLRLVEDAIGLRAEIDLPDTNLGRDVAELIRRRDLQGMSFGFTAERDAWDLTGPVALRTIHEIGELLDVSPVSYPAYEKTSIGLRSSAGLARLPSASLAATKDRSRLSKAELWRGGRVAMEHERDLARLRLALLA